MKVQNMTSSQGNPVPNQFIISNTIMSITFNQLSPRRLTGDVFQSYNSCIAFIPNSESMHSVYLDRDTWDYSVTTGKYRNQFLGENKAETQKKIDSGEYILTDLNG